MSFQTYLEGKNPNPKHKSYPELDAIVEKLAKETAIQINKLSRDAKADTPYKTQYVLEELIRVLEEKV